MERASSTSWPVTTGTRTSCGPVDTVMVTFVPLETCEPCAGDCSVIWPSGTESLGSSFTRLFRLRPASFSSCAASEVFLPVRSGTSVISLPEDTTSEISVPFGTELFGPGSVRITRPRSISACGRSRTRSSRPRSWSLRSASSWVRFLTSGTLTVSAVAADRSEATYAQVPAPSRASTARIATTGIHQRRFGSLSISGVCVSG